MCELLKTRRSIRKYRPEQVPDELLDAVLEAARLAPSACNAQPYHFTVCRGQAAKAVVASHCSSEPAARLGLGELGKAPRLTAGLHLGEGTGAVASIPLWDMALAVYDHCYSFTEGGITPYSPQC